MSGLRVPVLLVASFLLPPTLAFTGCHAQQPASAPAASVTTGQPLTVALQRRVEVLLRQRADLPPGSTVSIGAPGPSDLPGFRTIPVTFSAEGKTSRPVNFMISDDGKTLAQFNKFDISSDPRNLVSAAGRPPRGGAANAPVLIVGFDDLECPFCARLHEEIFPAILKRYGNNVRIVYKDFPLSQHPWAMHAAVDVNCLADQSAAGYWNAVDSIHAHAGEIGEAAGGGPKDKTLPRADEQLDKQVLADGAAQHVDQSKLQACLTKQDTTAVEASVKLGESLGVESTPVLFINGDKIVGAVPLQFIYGTIDDALRAEGVTPPPAYVPPPESPAAATGSPAGMR